MYPFKFCVLNCRNAPDAAKNVMGLNTSVLAKYITRTFVSKTGFDALIPIAVACSFSSGERCCIKDVPTLSGILSSGYVPGTPCLNVAALKSICPQSLNSKENRDFISCHPFFASGGSFFPINFAIALSASVFHSFPPSAGALTSI